jgi:hypothetical protein
MRPVGIADIDNMTNLMHFFNHVAGFHLYNDKNTFALYLAICCGTTIDDMQRIITGGSFVIMPGMLQSLLADYAVNMKHNVLAPMFTSLIKAYNVKQVHFSFSPIPYTIKEEASKHKPEGREKLQYCLMVNIKGTGKDQQNR